MKVNEFLTALYVNNSQILSRFPNTVVRYPFEYFDGKQTKANTMVMTLVADSFNNLKGVMLWSDALVRVTSDKLVIAKRIIKATNDMVNDKVGDDVVMIDNDNDLRVRIFLSSENINMDSYGVLYTLFVSVCSSVMGAYNES